MFKLAACIFLSGCFLASLALAQDISKEPARDYLKLVNADCAEAGHVFKCNIIVQNISKTQDIKEVTFQFEYTASEGTVLISDEKTVYELIPANKRKAVRIESTPHPQAKSAHVSIFDAKWK